MAIKKSELYSSLWKSCDELRGGIHASQYKDYILTLLFVKYVSDKYAGDYNALIVVPDGGSFADMVKLKGDKEIGEKINKIIGRLAEENDLRGVIDVADFNDAGKLGSGREMVDRLSNLIGIFDQPEMDFTKDSYLAGDTFECLLRLFSDESGGRNGQFHPPVEVSHIMAKTLGISEERTAPDTTIYDPTCGSGSLLLQVAKKANYNVALYGQEMNSTVSAQAKMNMILHNAETAEIATDNVLNKPKFF